MKNIFKKTLKFISSRLLYLVVGIFLAVGATYVYATWDQARTGGSGQLSETNWNELANMVQSEFSSLNTKVDGISGGGAGTYMMGNSSQVYGCFAKYTCDNFGSYHLCGPDEWTGRLRDPAHWVANTNIAIGGWVDTGTNSYDLSNPAPDCGGYSASNCWFAAGRYGTTVEFDATNGWKYYKRDCYSANRPPLCCSN